MLLSASFVAFLSIISIGSTEEEEKIFDYDSLKEVGSIEPPLCTIIRAVHIDSQYIYVFCEFGLEFREHGYNIYEKQKPFDLLSLILLFDIKFGHRKIESQRSTVSRCFYIHYFGSEVWRIGIDDHVVTTVLSTNFLIHSLAISSNGQLFILDGSDTFSIHIYASDGSPVDEIEFPFLNGPFCKEVKFRFRYWVPTIVHVGGDNIFMANSECDNLARETWIGSWSITKLKDRMEEERFIWKEEKLRQKRLVVLLPMSHIGERKKKWVEVTKNDEGMLTYFDPYSSTTKNVSNRVLLGEKEVFDKLSFSYFNIDRNIGFVCKDRYKTIFYCVGLDRISHECNKFSLGSGSKKKSEMILIYKCLNQTSWCQKTVENAETMQGRDCPLNVGLYRSKGNLFIKPSSLRTLMIYTIM